LCFLVLVAANVVATATLTRAEAENAAARVSLAVAQRADVAADQDLRSANAAASALLAAGTVEAVALTGYVDASTVDGLNALLPEVRKSIATDHPHVSVTTHPDGPPQTLDVVHAETRTIRQETKRDQATIAQTKSACRRLTGLVDGAADSLDRILDSVEKTSPSVLAANPLADAHSVDTFTSTVTAAAQARPQASTPRSFALTAALLTVIHNYSAASAAVRSSQSAAASG